MLSNLSFLIKSSQGIATEHELQMFEIEKETFATVYSRCPKTITEFRDRYNSKSLVLVLCLIEDDIVAFRLFERINDEQIQSMFLVVKEKYRGNKLSNVICSLSHQYFKWSGYKYITSWTHISITASKILAKYAPYVSEHEDLNDIEIKLLNSFEAYQNKPAGHYGTKRRVKNFYDMLNHVNGDAFFWAHII